jgi:hypothetical protein
MHSILTRFIRSSRGRFRDERARTGARHHHRHGHGHRGHSRRRDCRHGRLAAGQESSRRAPCNAWLLQLWVDNQVAGEVRVRSPKFHDNVDAIRSRVQIGLLDPLLPWGCHATALPAGRVHRGALRVGRRRRHRVGRVAGLLPGSAGAECAVMSIGTKSKGRRSSTSSASVSPSRSARPPATTAGAPSTPTRILLQANTDYAVLGMSTNTECAAICLRGPDTGNLR